MIFSFSDLFTLDVEGGSVTPKKTLRLGALKMTPHVSLQFGDLRLGFDIAAWQDKKFDVDLDGDVLVVKRII